MYGFLIFIYILICIALVVVILLQSSKGGGLAGAFGGGGGDMGAVFGGRGAATFLSRMTTWLAVAFLVFSMVISLINRGKTEGTSLVQEEQQKRAAVPASGLPVVPNSGGSLLPVSPGNSATTPADSAQ